MISIHVAKILFSVVAIYIGTFSQPQLFNTKKPGIYWANNQLATLNLEEKYLSENLTQERCFARAWIFLCPSDMWTMHG